jgi:hypothetical protein
VGVVERRTLFWIGAVLLMAAVPAGVVAQQSLAAYFPMTQGTVWIYRANSGGEFMLRVGVATRVGPVDCRLIETVIEGNVTQQECYRVEKDGVYTIQRSTATGSVLLTPPQRILASPVSVGQKWQWNGRIGDQPIVFYYTWARRENLVTPAGTFPAMQLYFEGNPAPQVRIQSWRWFAPGVGLVKEDTTLQQGAQTSRNYAELVQVIMGK